MTAVEVFFPGMAITSILMADPIPTTSGREIGITQLIRVAPVVVAEADVHVHVPALVQAVDEPAVARKTPITKMKINKGGEILCSM